MDGDISLQRFQEQIEAGAEGSTYLVDRTADGVLLRPDLDDPHWKHVVAVHGSGFILSHSARLLPGGRYSIMDHRRTFRAGVGPTGGRVSMAFQQGRVTGFEYSRHYRREGFRFVKVVDEGRTVDDGRDVIIRAVEPLGLTWTEPGVVTGAKWVAGVCALIAVGALLVPLMLALFA